MTAPYRDELAALEARYAALEAEVAERERARDEAARMLAEAKARARNEEIAADIRSGGPERRHQRRMMIGATVGMAVIGASAAYMLATRKSTREERIEAALTQYARFADETCACKDKACSDAVQDRMTKWAQEMARHPDFRDEKPDEETIKRATKIAERYTACLTKTAEKLSHDL